MELEELRRQVAALEGQVAALASEVNTRKVAIVDAGGKARIVAEVGGDGVAHLSFLVDGRIAATIRAGHGDDGLDEGDSRAYLQFNDPDGGYLEIFTGSRGGYHGTTTVEEWRAINARLGTTPTSANT